MPIRSCLLVLMDKATAARDIEATLACGTLKDSFVQVLGCTILNTPDAMAVDAGVAFWGRHPHAEEADSRAWAEAIAAQKDVSERAQELAHKMGSYAEVCAEVRRRSRYCDLVVFSGCSDAGLNADRISLIEDTLMTAGRPVLLLPANHRERPKAERIVLGWDESGASLAAARAAISIRPGGTITDIVVIDPSPASPERSDVAGPLARYLTVHGVKCEVYVMSRPQGRSVANCLLDRSQDADMLVIGGYGHSRLRERVFGGTTHDIIRNATCPVLLAH